jgi:hypothetical protein
MDSMAVFVWWRSILVPEQTEDESACSDFDLDGTVEVEYVVEGVVVIAYRRYKPDDKVCVSRD